MKKTTLALTLSTIITLASNAQALELMVVDNYHTAGSSEIWKKVKTDQVPNHLLNNVSIDGPQNAYASTFPKTFLQESLFAVCYRDCNAKDFFEVNNDSLKANEKARWDLIEQANVYYWLKKYFAFLDKEINFKPKKFLKVTTDRQYRENGSRVLKNNAFFDPRDISLSFLPASHSILFKVLAGKINRSGYDPSVIVHEASHYIFHHLFPNAVNNEIGGLNEGFADYMANIFLDNPKVGLVMLHGRALRDSSNHLDSDKKIKSYAPNMEVHDLGERVSFALWRTREVATNKTEFDRLVIDAVSDLNSDPYATIHDFKAKMNERLPYIVQSEKLDYVKSVWNIVFPGEAIKLENTNILDEEPVITYKATQVTPLKQALALGINTEMEISLNIHDRNASSKQSVGVINASHNGENYQVAVDLERSNFFGIYDSSKNLVTENIEDLNSVLYNAQIAVNSTENFMTKVKAFAELSQGQGDFSVAYKIKDKSQSSQNFTFNGVEMSGTKIKLNLKRRMLVGLLLGLPNIESMEIFLVPQQNIKNLPVINGQTVIGYNLQLESGISTSVILEQHSLN